MTEKQSSCLHQLLIYCLFSSFLFSIFATGLPLFLSKLPEKIQISSHFLSVSPTIHSIGSICSVTKPAFPILKSPANEWLQQCH